LKRPAKRPSVPGFPETLRVVLVDCYEDEPPQFHSLQPDESVPEDVIAVRTYALVPLKWRNGAA